MMGEKEIGLLVEDYLELFLPDVYLVEVEINPGRMIVVEVDSDRAVGLDDCALLSRYLEEQLCNEVEDFELEVGSSGITSPFKTHRQYEKNIGKEVEVLFKAGMKRTGILKEVHQDGIVLSITEQIKEEGKKRKVSVERDFPHSFEEIKQTKYLFRFK